MKMAIVFSVLALFSPMMIHVQGLEHPADSEIPVQFKCPICGKLFYSTDCHVCKE